MNIPQAIKNIKTAIDGAPRKEYTVEFHVQMIKYADVLRNVDRKEFCDMLEVVPAWGTEFMKMRKIAARLRKAGLDPEKI